MGKRNGERVRQRLRQIDKQKDRSKDRQTDIMTGRRDRETGGQKDKEKEGKWSVARQNTNLYNIKEK